jgi:hypothetical protein
MEMLVYVGRVGTYRTVPGQCEKLAARSRRLLGPIAAREGDQEERTRRGWNRDMRQRLSGTKDSPLPPLATVKS